MKATIKFEGETWEVDLSDGIDLSLPIQEARGPRCFGAERPRIEPMKGEGWVAKVSHGGSVNAFTVFFNPHGNGTHTEGPGHISSEFIGIQEVHRETHLVAALITVGPEDHEGDLVITRYMLKNKLDVIKGMSGLILRTLPNEREKTDRDYTGTNPPYFSVDAIAYLVEKGIRHLLVDLPSIDKEDDGGRVAGHKAYWNHPTFRNRETATITEMIFVPDEVKDGWYFLNLQRAAFDLDCAPSRPIIFRMKKLLRNTSYI